VTERPPAAPSGGAWSRRILLISLALNLFFIGAWAALAWRHYAHWHGHGGPFTPATRIERLAAALPQDDANKLRAEFKARAANVEATTAAFRAAQRHVRDTLRAEPFNLDALKSGMADARAARLKLDEALQDVIATASAAMTPEGRRRLADWTPAKRSGNEKRR
jgi:uncharacterized membrane protein